MGIEGIGGGKIIDIKELQGRGQARGAARSRASERTGEVSNDGKSAAGPAKAPTGDERARLLAAAKDSLNELPAVREDKVIEAKLRISTGYYDNETVRKEVLRSLLASILPAGTPADGAPPDGSEGAKE
jgi:hypothetical protein